MKSDAPIACNADQDADNVFELFVSTPEGKTNVNVSGPLALSTDVLLFNWSPKSFLIDYVADRETDGIFVLLVFSTKGKSNTKVSGPLLATGDVVGFASDRTTSKLVYWADQEVDEQFELFLAPSGGGNVVKISDPMSGVGGRHLGKRDISPASAAAGPRAAGRRSTPTRRPSSGFDEPGGTARPLHRRVATHRDRGRASAGVLQVCTAPAELGAKGARPLLRIAPASAVLERRAARSAQAIDGTDRLSLRSLPERLEPWVREVPRRPTLAFRAVTDALQLSLLVLPGKAREGLSAGPLRAPVKCEARRTRSQKSPLDSLPSGCPRS